jgi:hypothetical protein
MNRAWLCSKPGDAWLRGRPLANRRMSAGAQQVSSRPQRRSLALHRQEVKPTFDAALGRSGYARSTAARL